MRRPVMIVSVDSFNRSRIATLICVAISGSTRVAAAPGNVALEAGDGGLRDPSAVNVSQVVTVDRRSLAGPPGHLEPAAMDLVDDGLRQVLAL